MKGLFDWGRKTTVLRVKSGKTETSAQRHKGHMVYERADGGFVVPSLDSSVFDTKRDANRFIDSWTKNDYDVREARGVSDWRPRDRNR